MNPATNLATKSKFNPPAGARRRRARCFAALAALAAVASAFALPPRAASAQEFRSDLGEAIDFLLEADGGAGREVLIPPDAPELTKFPLGAQPPAELLDHVPGEPFHDMKAAPVRTLWWKYPIYAVIGFPRDAIDTLFGVAASVPGLNIPVVGLAYEVIPTQALMRDPRDWHRWPGRANKRGHGFVDAEGWGWFPNARSMEFTETEPALREKYQAENDDLTIQLQGLNKEVEERRRAWTAKLTETREAALRAIQRGSGFEAAARMLPYSLAVPGDQEGAALLIAALAVHGDSGPEWVKPYLWRALSQAGLAGLRRAEALLAPAYDADPNSRTLAEALVFARIRLEQPELAMLTAITSTGKDAKDARRARLAFETALSARDAKTAREGLAPIQLASASQASLAPLEQRLGIVEGRAAKAVVALRALVAAAPGDPYLAYYLGVAELESLDKANDPMASLNAAVGHLEQAAGSAANWALRDRAGRSLSFARSLAAGPSKPKAPHKGFFSE